MHARDGRKHGALSGAAQERRGSGGCARGRTALRSVAAGGGCGLCGLLLHAGGCDGARLGTQLNRRTSHALTRLPLHPVGAGPCLLCLCSDSRVCARSGLVSFRSGSHVEHVSAVYFPLDPLIAQQSGPLFPSTPRSGRGPAKALLSESIWSSDLLDKQRSLNSTFPACGTLGFDSLRPSPSCIKAGALRVHVTALRADFAALWQACSAHS